MSSFLFLYSSIPLAGLGWFFINNLNKWDKEITFYFKKKDLMVFASFLLFNNYLILYRIDGELSFLHVYTTFFVGYLYLSAWIDHYTMRVYRISNVFFCFSGLLLFLLYNPSFDEWLGIILYVIFVSVLTAKNMFGKGDSGIFISVALYLGCLNYSNFTITILLIHNVLSSIVFLIMNYKKLQVRAMKIKQETAFLPSIAIAAWIMMIFYI